MIPYDEALEILRQCANPLAPVMLPIADAVGHICADTVVSRETVSPFDNSAMDGFAVVSTETAHFPVSLTVQGSSVAGDRPSTGAGGAWEIMTGAPVPEGYDAVVKIEDVEITARDANGRPERISLNAPVPLGNNIRKAGEDFKPGDVVIPAGVRIDAVAVMALATVGIDWVAVYPKPRVAVLSTGKEVVDDITTPLQLGQIRNSNAPYLLAALAEMDAYPSYAGVIHDEPEVFEQRVSELLPKTDVMISTGAVSVGRHDFVPDSLRKLGAEICFHKVAIRPGKPILYATFPDGTQYFGLPGNPVSAAVGLRFFVQPCLVALTGSIPQPQLTAVLDADTQKKQGFRFFRKAHAYLDVQHQLCVFLLDGQESFKIHPLLQTNCWAVLPEGMEQITKGTPVAIVPLAQGRLMPGVQAPQSLSNAA